MSFQIMAAVLIIVTAIAHTLLAERRIFTPLAEKTRMDGRALVPLRQLQLLRCIWFLGSATWVIWAVWIVVQAQSDQTPDGAAMVAVTATLLAYAAGNAWIFRLRHVGWIMLSLSALLLWL